MKIAIWSPTVFAGRKSANLLLLALQAITQDGGEQLVLHADIEGSGPEHFLLSGSRRSRMMKKKEFGIEYLCRLLHCERFSGDLVRNAGYSFMEEKLHILPAGNHMFYEGREREAANDIICMVQCAEQVFQNVWIELPAGESEFSKTILSNVDCVIFNLTQSPYEVAKIEHLPHYVREFYLFGAYEQRNIYTLHNLLLLYPRLRGKSAVIPYQPSFLSACCEGEAEKYWLRGKSNEAINDTTVMFQAVSKAYSKWKEGGKEALCGREENAENDRSLNLLHS